MTPNHGHGQGHGHGQDHGQGHGGFDMRLVDEIYWPDGLLKKTGTTARYKQQNTQIKWIVYRVKKALLLGTIQGYGDLAPGVYRKLVLRRAEEMEETWNKE